MSNGNEKIFHIILISKTGASPLDGLMSQQDIQILQGSSISGVSQSYCLMLYSQHSHLQRSIGFFSAAPINWAKINHLFSYGLSISLHKSSSRIWHIIQRVWIQTRVNKSSQPYNLSWSGEVVRFIDFTKLLSIWKIQITTYRIWTLFARFFFDDYGYNNTSGIFHYRWNIIWSKEYNIAIPDV